MRTLGGHDNLCDSVLTRVSLILSSPEALKLSRVDKHSFRVIKGSRCTRDVWWSCLDAESVSGIVSPRFFWLHALLDWNEIARYSQDTRLFAPLCELRFHSHSEVAALVAAIKLQQERRIGRIISGLNDAHLFLGDWIIPADELNVFKHSGGGAHVQSLPVRFTSEYGDFSVELILTFTTAGTYRLTWGVDIPLKVRIEAPSSIEFDVSGELVLPDIEKSCVARIHDSYQNRVPSDDAEDDLVRRNTFTKDSQVYKMIVAGQPLRCFARIAMSCMGERCPVHPSCVNVHA